MQVLILMWFTILIQAKWCIPQIMEVVCLIPHKRLALPKCPLPILVVQII